MKKLIDTVRELCDQEDEVLVLKIVAGYLYEKKQLKASAIVMKAIDQMIVAKYEAQFKSNSRSKMTDEEFTEARTQHATILNAIRAILDTAKMELVPMKAPDKPERWEIVLIDNSRDIGYTGEVLYAPEEGAAQEA